MWSRTSATTRSSSSSRMTYPHSQVTWLAIGLPLSPTIVGPGPCHYLGPRGYRNVETNAASMVRIQLRGRFAVVIDGRQVEARLPGRQGRLLVAYLATYRAQPVARTVPLPALCPPRA